MADQERKELESGEMNDLIDHWVQVIDRWVQDVDRGMGGAADGADPDSAPEPMFSPTPAAEAG